MCRNREHKLIEQAWEQILADFDIRYQQYYTMSLVGKHIHRLIIMTNSTEICTRTEVLMLASVTTDEDRDSIKLFMGHMSELMEAFDFLCAVMTRTMIQSEETIAEFGSAAKWFGVNYREYFNKDATPKVHYLETHLIEELIRHKRLGLFDESPIERAHHTNHVYSRLFSNIENWFNRQEAIENRIHMGDVPDVHEAHRSLED